MYQDLNSQEPLVNVLTYDNNNDGRRPGIMAKILIVLLTIAPIALGIGICYYFAHKEEDDIDTDEQDDLLTKIMIYLKLINISNIKFNMYALVISFGVIFPQLTITALLALLLDKVCTTDKELINYDSKPKLYNFYEISIIPVGILLYASLFELVLDKSPTSLVILLISVSYMLVMKLALIFPALCMIMATFPYRFWRLKLCRPVE